MRKMFKLFLLFYLIMTSELFAGTQYLQGNVVIDKDTEYKGKWEIKENTKIIIKDNIRCIFSGEIKINGKKGKPVVISGNKKSVLNFNKSPEVVLNYANITGMEVVEFSESNAKINNCDFSGNKLAIRFVKNSKGAVLNTTIKNSEIGLVSELKSFVEINNSSFFKNEKAVISNQSGLIELKNSELKQNNVAFYINNDGKNIVKNCQFVDNEASVVLHQNGATEISFNNFFKNKLAVYAETMSVPVIHNNKFSDNDIALKFVQFVEGVIKENTFINNNTAVYLEKKSSPQVRQNKFKNNVTAIFCDFSSYPVITLNDFLDNKMHIKLGIYQSADFENRVGSLQLQVSEAMAKETKRVADFNKQRKFFVGEVFAKKNYWDEKTIKEMETKENVSTIYDGHDLPETKYDGYGDETYRLDVVVFKPFLKNPATK